MVKRIFLILAFLFVCICAVAQEGAHGAYSPYSIYGIGDISKEGTAFNKGMGGTGIATRNKRFINYLNPAAVTARDSLSFMADFGLVQNNTIYIEGEIDEKYYIKPEERAQGKTSPYAFRVKKIMLLGNVAETFVKGFSISITTTMLSPAFREKLVSLVKELMNVQKILSDINDN